MSERHQSKLWNVRIFLISLLDLKDINTRGNRNNLTKNGDFLENPYGILNTNLAVSIRICF